MNAIEKTCFFTGHRKLPKDQSDCIRDLLYQEIERHIHMGVTTFLSGGATGFDTMAAECVIAMREKYPWVRLELYFPCHHPGACWSDADLVRCHRIMGMADEIRYAKESYTPECIRERNEMLVRDAEYGIAFLLTGHSGTGQTLAYAKKHGRQIVNLATRID